MSNVNDLGADGEAVMAAIPKIDKPEVDIVLKLEKLLGWSNERLRCAVEELRAEGRVGPTLNDGDGGRKRLLGFELL